MSQAEKAPEDIQDLIDDYLSGLLDEDRLRQLEERLRASEEVRQYFVRYCRLHTDLHLQARAQQAGERALRNLDLSSDTSADAVACPESPTKDAPRSHPRLHHVLAYLPAKTVAAAAVLLLAVGFGWWLTRDREEPAAAGRSQEVAWLVNAQNCQWADASAPAGTMRAGTVLSIERGLAEICFRSGARVVLEGPASLELLSSKSARLRHGKLTARVPEPRTGFEILSPQGKVIDLGTEFGVSVSDKGATQVYVFEGEVQAHATNDGKTGAVSLTQHQAARIAAGKVTRQASVEGTGADRFVRAIVPPPVILPRTLRLTFDGALEASIRDATGLGTGLTQRLPGTGSRLPERDPNLRLDTVKAQLELTTTRSDIRNQVRLFQGEYLGIRLADFGFTGKEDFAVTAVIPNTPALEDYGQFGLYAGTRSDQNIRGGLIKWGWGRTDPGQNTQFLVNNNGGADTDLYKVGLLSPGTSLRLTLLRTGGKYSLTVENLTEGGASTLQIRHPEYLDGQPDLFVGLFGANPYSDVRKTLVVKEFSVTVWTVAPPVVAGRAD